MHPRFLSAVFFILGSFGMFIFFASHNEIPVIQPATHVAVISRLALANGAVLGEQTIVPSFLNTLNQQSAIQKKSTIHVSVSETLLQTNYQGDTALTIHDGIQAVTEKLEAGSIGKDAFVRVIKANENSPENKSWRKVTLLRETQAQTSDRKSIDQLLSPATYTFTYSKERLGSVKEDSLTVFYFNPAKNRWIGTRTSVDTSHHTVTAVFATQNVRFAVFGKP